MSEVVKDANLGVKQHGTRACAIGRLADGLARAAAVAACLIPEAQVATVLGCDTSSSVCQGGWPALSVSPLSAQRTS